jgi:hypothetical protein
MYLLPGGRRVDRGSLQRHSVLNHGSILNLEVVDLLDTREKPGADVVRSDEALSADSEGRRLGVLPTLSQWVRLIDNEMCEEGVDHETPYAFLSCGPACRFDAKADEVMLWPIYPGYACSEIERTHWREPTVASICRWLRQYAVWISDRDWSPIMERDLRALLSDIRAVTGNDGPPAMLCLNISCANVGNIAYPQHGGAWYRCSACNTAWTRQELINRAERDAPRTLAECSKLLNIPERSLWRYLAQDPPPFRPVVEHGVPLKRGKALLYRPRDVDQGTRSLRYRNAELGQVS